MSQNGWVRVPEDSRTLTASIEVESKLADLGLRRHVPPAGPQLGTAGVHGDHARAPRWLARRGHRSVPDGALSGGSESEGTVTGN